MKVKFKFSGKEHQIQINRLHYLRRLDLPDNHTVTETILENMDWAAQWYQANGDPWLEIFELDVHLKEERVFLNNLQIQSPKVYRRFKKYEVKKAMLIAATAGAKVDKKINALWSADHPDRSFFLNTYASSVTEALVEFATDQIGHWTIKKQERTLSRYSPGYPGWDLNEQKVLMKIIEAIIGNIPISISETALLNPLKSQLSLVGISKGEQIEEKIKPECMQCSFKDCSCRNKEMYIKM